MLLIFLPLVIIILCIYNLYVNNTEDKLRDTIIYILFVISSIILLFMVNVSVNNYQGDIKPITSSSNLSDFENLLNL